LFTEVTYCALSYHVIWSLLHCYSRIQQGATFRCKNRCNPSINHII